jgi:hypothetical protein
MEPPSKTLKASYGVSYKEPKVTLDGEPYENRPSEKKRMTRSQFLEMSASIGVVRNDAGSVQSLDQGDISKILKEQDSLETTIQLPGNNTSLEKQVNSVQDFGINKNLILNDSQSLHN